MTLATLIGAFFWLLDSVHAPLHAGWDQALAGLRGYLMHQGFLVFLLGFLQVFCRFFEVITWFFGFLRFFAKKPGFLTALPLAVPPLVPMLTMSGLRLRTQ